MSFQPIVEHITIYPIKSLDGISLQEVAVAKGGCLLHDREYAIFTEEGKLLNGKSNAMVHLLRSTYDLEKGIFFLRHQDEKEYKTFHPEKDSSSLNRWLSEFFGRRVMLRKESTGRFLDIPDVSGMTIVSTASLMAVRSWFSIPDVEEVRRRFRASIEIGGVPAFWEDQLFTSKGRAVNFTLGQLNVVGIQPRERCVVPTRNPENAQVLHAFPRLFAGNRQREMPAQSNLNSYDHYYYLSVDCHLPDSETGKLLRIGDELKLKGIENLPEGIIV